MTKHSPQQRSLFQFTENDVVPVDPCANRHGGSETSQDAHDRVGPHKREVYARIMSLARQSGSAGITVHEVAEYLQTTPNAVSGRLTELKVMGRLVYAADDQGEKVRRRGAYVLVVGKEEV